MNTPFQEIENLYFRIQQETSRYEEKCPLLLKVYVDLVCILTDASSLHFNTLFARVSYVCTRYQLSMQWSYAMQIIRREHRVRQIKDDELEPILAAVIEYLFIILRQESGSVKDTPAFPALPKLPPSRRAGRFKKKFARVVALECDKEKKILTVLDESSPDSPCYVHYCVHGVNDIYCDTLELSIREIGLPLTLGLVDVDTWEEDHYIPAYIVTMPDLLIDVTGIAQAMPSGGDPYSMNIMEHFLPSDSNQAILTGHVANFFLDELVRNPDADFKDLFTKSFKLFPIEFIQLSDDHLREMYAVMSSHFDNIRAVILDRFPDVGIDRTQCVIEPSYFSPHYGIKGRLDLYYHHPAEQSASIVELKSSKPFKPNSYGLSSANYFQTLLYELLIKSVHGPDRHRANFILYSCLSYDTLRYAVSVESLQKESIQTRNELVLLLFRLLQLKDPENRDITEEISIDNLPDIKGYLKKNIERWEAVYSKLSSGEKNYFKHFTSFITREHMIARIGSDHSDDDSGLANLWLQTPDAKEERYRILRRLELLDIESTGHQTLLKFARGNLTNPLANFRAGDIAVLYPFDEETGEDPTRHQIYRANIIAVTPEEVVVRLRNNQVHTEQIQGSPHWNLEPDLLDSSFRSLYQSLWTFIASPPETKQLLFGLKRPSLLPATELFPVPKGLTAHQQKIYQDALRAVNMYLLWGPPGTGKTSRMLKSWVWYFYTQTPKRIALLAYTNRAVDEICHTLNKLGKDVESHYIRIGSRAGTGEHFRCRLLDQLIEPLNTRNEIKEMLNSTRIFVGTIASFQGKSEIFKLVDFDVALIDEASQILEPAMTGLLTRFQKTILIGDHMQLPAVSTQSKQMSQIAENTPWAKQIGLTDMSMSFFERIYRLYSSKGWSHVIGILHEQGRMHQDIQQFANTTVYDQQLTCLSEKEQTIRLEEITGAEDNPLFFSRLVFMPTENTLEETCKRTNNEEAEMVVRVISEWQGKIIEKQLNWSIGVITPFRAQIAAILHKAHLSGVDLRNVTVDTVERYQGGARDIVIMSASVNSSSMLTRIVSQNDEGVDRKLNVAVTRARQQFILLGNERILSSQKAYKALIGMSHNIKLPVATQEV